MELREPYRTFVHDIHGMIGLSESDFDLFRRHRAFFTENGPALVDAMATILKEHPPSREVFDSGRGDLESLGRRLSAWLGEVLEAHDTPEFWHRQFIIGVEHIVRKIPNRQMVGLATRIRGLLLPMMLDSLGPEDGVRLFAAFSRLLDSVVALTTTLVDEGQSQCLLEATGFTQRLADNLRGLVFQRIRDELLATT